MNATYFVPLVGITLMAVGLIGVGAAAWRSHKTQSRLDFIRSLGAEAEVYAATGPPVIERVQTPLLERMFGPARRGLRHNLSRLYPSSDIDRVHADLLKAGLTGSVRAEEFVAVQVGAVMLGIGVGPRGAGERRGQRQDRPGHRVHPAHARWPGAQLVAAPPHQGAARCG